MTAKLKHGVAKLTVLMLSLGCGAESPDPAPTRPAKPVVKTVNKKAPQPVKRSLASKAADYADKFPPLIAYYDDATKKFGFLNRLGEIAMEPKYTSAVDFHQGKALVWIEEEAFQIDQKGRTVFTVPKSCHGATYSEGRFWRQAINDRFALHDETGKELVPPTFDVVQIFSEGYAGVNTGSRRSKGNHGEVYHIGGNWGFVDRTGKQVIPARYDRVDPFSDGLASVKKGDKWSYIDGTGRTVIEVTEGTPFDFQEGLAPIHIGTYDKPAEFVTRYIDKKGRKAFEIKGIGEPFHEGLAQVTTARKADGQYLAGFVDKSGAMVIKPQFFGAKPFKEGLAAVKVVAAKEREPDGKNRWGFCDKSGKIVIEAIYDEVASFQDGIAKVHVNGTQNRWPQKPPFPERYYWNDGEWWLIDKQGKKITVLERLSD